MTPYYDHGGVTIYYGDSYELLPSLQAGLADMLVADSPYASAATTATSGFAREKWGVNWADMSLVTLMLAQVIRRPFLAPGHQVYWFCDPFGFAAMWPAFVRQYPLVQSVVWDKDMLGIGTRHRKQTEFIIHACDKDAPAMAATARDLVRLRPIYAEKEHPSAKPVELLQQLLGLTEWRCALDPFMGTGPTLIAAKRLGRRAIGIELNERYCEIAARRLAQETLPFAPSGTAGGP